MSTLDEAREHLEQAINRLDGAIDRRLEATGSQAGDVSEETLARLETERARLAGEFDSLRGEHTKLSDALNDAQKNYAASKVVNEAVAVRLDGVIGQAIAVVLKAGDDGIGGIPAGGNAPTLRGSINSVWPW